MPIPSPEVIASSVIASGVSATAAVTGSIVLQSVINQLKKLMTKIFKKVLKKEIADKKEIRYTKFKESLRFSRTYLKDEARIRQCKATDL